MKQIKKTLCLVLSLSILMLSVSVLGFASGSELSVAVASDLHIERETLDSQKLADGADNIYCHATIQGQMAFESWAILNSFKESFLKKDSKILLVPGDITNGNIEDHRSAAQVFGELENEGKKVFVVPGNHDILKETANGYTSPEKFAEIYGEFGFNEALSRDTASLSYTAKLSNAYRLLAIDSCIYGEDKGELKEETMAWLDSELEKAKNDGVKLVAMMHHSLLPHMGLYSLTGMLIKDSEALAKKFSDNGVKCIFTGHFHSNDISMAQPDGGNTVYDVMTGSLIVYPNAYRQVSFSDSGINVSTDYITSIDKSYLPSGFSSKQINAINNDFSAYSKGFFGAGIEKLIDSYIGSSHKLAKKLKLDENGAVAKKLDELMPAFSNALKMNIYGETDSLDAVAALAGYSIPESKYNSIAEIAVEVMRNLYSGDEAIGKNSVEARVLFASLRAALIYAGCDFCDRLISIPSDITSKIPLLGGINKMEVAAKIAYATASADEIMLAVFSPIIDSVTSDAYEPGDLNVTLEAYGTSKAQSGGAPMGILQKLKYIVAKFADMIGSIFANTDFSFINDFIGGEKA